MIVSEQWLRELIKTDLNANEIADVLTLAGLEVDAVEQIGGGLDKVVVGEVLKVSKHPDADKLQLTEVYVGGETLNIVCGASNVAEGVRVPVAMVGAKLPNGLKIKKAKVRGEASFGMLCSASELSLEDSSDGLMLLPADAPVGVLVADYLDLNDTLIDIDLTPNRGDCLSMQGIARELRVLADAEYIAPKVVEKSVNSQESIDVTVEETALCPSYIARVVSDVNAAAETPLWIQQRLLRSGVRPISAVVDITNYVMLELGQPMHAFNADAIDGGIVVRLAKDGEKLTLLDDTEVKLSADTLVIADAKKPMAIAGVMGGADSGVQTDSTTIVFEAAHFTRKCAAGKARAYGLATDSSHRFERGVDPLLPEKAMERATELLVDICGGKVGSLNKQVSQKDLSARPVVTLRFDRLNKLLGMPLETTVVDALLRRISPDVKQVSGEWRVESPSYRFDIERECDLVEEVARVMGYDNLEDKMPSMQSTAVLPAENKVDIRRLKQTLIASAYSEAISYSFVGKDELEELSEASEFINLKNPLAENMAVMRTSLWPGLINACLFNLNRQKSTVRLFEVGKVFNKNAQGEIIETNKLAGILTGARDADHWSQGSSDLIDYFDAKSDLERVFSLTGCNTTTIFSSLHHKALHPGQTAEVIIGDKSVGILGKLHPNLANLRQLPSDTFLFELDLDAVLAGTVPEFESVSKFPEVTRDLSLVVQDKVAIGDLLTMIRNLKVNDLNDVALFDVYSGEGVPEGSKSAAIKLAFQHKERTLNDAEIDTYIQKILKALKQDFGATLRG